MALLYADEDFSYPMVQRLRPLGHDLLTTAHDSYRPAVAVRKAPTPWYVHYILGRNARYDAR